MKLVSIPNKALQQLAHFSNRAHESVKSYLTANPPKERLSAVHLGRLRVEIKKHLQEDMKEIDELVRGVIGLKNYFAKKIGNLKSNY